MLAIGTETVFTLRNMVLKLNKILKNCFVFQVTRWMGLMPLLMTVTHCSTHHLRSTPSVGSEFHQSNLLIGACPVICGQEIFLL